MGVVNIPGDKNESAKQRPIVSVPLELLLLRSKNGRISLEVEERENELSHDEEEEITQASLEKIIQEQNLEDFENLNKLLKKDGQTKEAIITPDGIVIDGNRRLVCLKHLHKENHNSFTRMKCIILPGHPETREKARQEMNYSEDKMDAIRLDSIRPLSNENIEKIETKLERTSDGKVHHRVMNQTKKFRQLYKKDIDLNPEAYKKENYKESLLYQEFRDVNADLPIDDYKKFTSSADRDNNLLFFQKVFDYIDEYLAYHLLDKKYSLVSAQDEQGKLTWFTAKTFYRTCILKAEKKVKDGEWNDVELYQFKLASFETFRAASATQGSIYKKAVKFLKMWELPQSKSFLQEIVKDRAIPTNDEHIKDTSGNLDILETNKAWNQEHATRIFNSFFKAEEELEKSEGRNEPLKKIEDINKDMEDFYENIYIATDDSTGLEEKIKLEKIANQIVGLAKKIYNEIEDARKDSQKNWNKLKKKGKQKNLNKLKK